MSTDRTASTASTPDTDRSGHGAAPHGSGGLAAARAAAMGLWVIVSAGLAYGVVQTVIRASQLFA